MSSGDLNVSESLESSIHIETIIILVLALILGGLGALVFFPLLSPGLVSSLVGTQAKGFWYLSGQRARRIWAAVVVHGAGSDDHQQDGPNLAWWTNGICSARVQ